LGAGGAGASADPSSASASAVVGAVPHGLLSVNEQGAYLAILAGATWTAPGDTKPRRFGKGAPAASDLKKISARVGSVLTVALDTASIDQIAAYAAPAAKYKGALATKSPFTPLRFTSAAATSGARIQFWAPAAGDWIVYASLKYPDGGGVGTYVWRVTVK
jgi:hypothetical protein